MSIKIISSGGPCRLRSCLPGAGMIPHCQIPTNQQPRRKHTPSSFGSGAWMGWRMCSRVTVGGRSFRTDPNQDHAHTEMLHSLCASPLERCWPDEIRLINSVCKLEFPDFFIFILNHSPWQAAPSSPHRAAVNHEVLCHPGRCFLPVQCQDLQFSNTLPRL